MILVLLDGSKRAGTILSHVEEMAYHFQPKIVFMQIIESHHIGNGGVPITSYYTRKNAMKSKTKQKTSMLLVLVGGAIPTALILSSYYKLSAAFTVVASILLSMLFGSIALWVNANRAADGSEWWQDDSASGWRGY